MAAQTTAPSERFIFGPLVARQWVLTSINNGDTLATPFVRILDVEITPTTAVAVGATINQTTNVVTFVTGGNIAANVWIIGREG